MLDTTSYLSNTNLLSNELVYVCYDLFDYENFINNLNYEIIECYVDKSSSLVTYQIFYRIKGN